MHFADRLFEAVRLRKNAVLVGIDPRPDQLPREILDRFPRDRAGLAGAIEAFGKSVVDVVAATVPAVKFQAAFYEALGPEGCAALARTAMHAREAGLIVILDGKRNDIGSTAEAYADAYLGGDAWDSDALTVNPYLGSDGIDPFVKAARSSGRGLFVLVRTSNPSAGEIQDLIAGDQPIYRIVADLVGAWAKPDIGQEGYGLVGAVVGATYPRQLAELRALLPHVPFLVPGYGAQGGTASDVSAAFDDRGLGAIVNNSRGITFAFRRPDLQARFGDDWKAAIDAAVSEMTEALAAQTPMGKLRG